MPKAAIAAAAFAAAVLIGVWSRPAAAIGPAAPAALAAAGRYSAPVRTIHYARRPWRQRRYWRWDGRPVWDDPWEVLRPTIWGSAEPHFVPADVWARKWHPAHIHHWTRRHYP
jgi:hypothetical protein